MLNDELIALISKNIVNDLKAEIEDDSNNLNELELKQKIGRSIKKTNLQIQPRMKAIEQQRIMQSVNRAKRKAPWLFYP